MIYTGCAEAWPLYCHTFWTSKGNLFHICQNFLMRNEVYSDPSIFQALEEVRKIQPKRTLFTGKFSLSLLVRIVLPLVSWLYFLDASNLPQFIDKVRIMIESLYKFVISFWKRKKRRQSLQNGLYQKHRMTDFSLTNEKFQNSP